jgi:hypothetical protein
VGNAPDSKARVGWFKNIPGFIGAHGTSFYGMNDLYINNPVGTINILFSEEMEMILGPHNNINVSSLRSWIGDQKPSTTYGFDYARAGALYPQ